MKRKKKVCQIIVSILLIVCMCTPSRVDVQAAIKAKMNYKKLTLDCGGKTKQLKLLGKNGSADGRSIKATYYDDNGKKVTKKLKVVWSSSDESVATVSSTGKVKSKKPGTATIIASYLFDNQHGYGFASCTVKVKHRGEFTTIKRVEPTKWKRGSELKKCNYCNKKITTSLDYKPTEEDVLKDVWFVLDVFKGGYDLQEDYNWAWEKLKNADSALEGVRPKNVFALREDGLASWIYMNISYCGGYQGYQKMVYDGKYCEDVDGHKKDERFDFAHDLKAGDVVVWHTIIGDITYVVEKYDSNEKTVIVDDIWDPDGNEINTVFKPGTYTPVIISEHGEEKQRQFFTNKGMEKVPTDVAQELYKDAIRDVLKKGFVDAVKVVNENDEVIEIYDRSFLEEPVERPEIYLESDDEWIEDSYLFEDVKKSIFFKSRKGSYSKDGKLLTSEVFFREFTDDLYYFNETLPYYTNSTDVYRYKGLLSQEIRN